MLKEKSPRKFYLFTPRPVISPKQPVIFVAEPLKVAQMAHKSINITCVLINISFVY